MTRPRATGPTARRRAIPPLLALGIFVFGAGGLADVVEHVGGTVWLPALEAYLGQAGELAHQALFVGMALIVAGLVQAGVSAGRSAAREPASDKTPGVSAGSARPPG